MCFPSKRNNGHCEIRSSSKLIEQQFCLSRALDDLHDNIQESVASWRDISSSCSQECVVDHQASPEIPRPSRYSPKSDQRSKFGSSSLKSANPQLNSYLTIDRKTQGRSLAASSEDSFFQFDQDQLKILACNLDKIVPQKSTMR